MIPTYRRPDQLRDALRTVMAQETVRTFEVLVVDNDCDEKVESQVASLAAGSSTLVRYLPVPALGLHNCRNLALLGAKGEIVVFVDDDVLAPKSWLGNISRPFEDLSVGGVAGRILPEWEGVRPGWTDALHPAYFSLLDLGDGPFDIRPPKTPYGCNMAYRRSLVVELGGFPPDGMGRSAFEWYRGDGEVGLAAQVYARNVRVVYAGDALLYHRIGPDRLTLDYVKSRTIKGAISEFYTEMRRNRYGTITLLGKGVSNLRASLWRAVSTVGKNRTASQVLRDRVSIVRDGARGLYQLRLAVDPRLRRWVLREHYLPYQERAAAESGWKFPLP